MQQKIGNCEKSCPGGTCHIKKSRYPEYLIQSDYHLFEFIGFCK